MLEILSRFILDVANYLDIMNQHISYAVFQMSSVLDFHRRVSIGFSQQLTASLAQLSRARNVTTPPRYLRDFVFMMGTIKSSVTRAVNAVSYYTNKIAHIHSNWWHWTVDIVYVLIYFHRIICQYMSDQMDRIIDSWDFEGTHKH